MRVDLLLENQRGYTFSNYAAKGVTKGFEELSIPLKLIYLEDGSYLQDYLEYVKHSPPNWTLSFADFSPNTSLMCDVTRIPHFFWLKNSLAPGLAYLYSKFGSVGISDNRLAERINQQNLIFLPHGTDEDVSSEKRVFDVVLFADLLDHLCLKKIWNEILTASEIQQIEAAIACEDPLQAEGLYFFVERYLESKKTSKLIHSFSKIPLDVFGEHMGNNWLVKLPTCIKLHQTLPFTEYFEVLKRASMAVLEPASIWFLPALYLGCLPVDSADIAQYYLHHPQEREVELERLRQQFPKRSWNDQVKQLVEFMHEN